MRVAFLGLCVLIGGGLGFWLISAGLLSDPDEDVTSGEPVGPVVVPDRGGREPEIGPGIPTAAGGGRTDVADVILVRGVVKSKDGTPLVRARLVGTPARGRQVATVTENDGTFELKGPPGVLESLVVAAPRHALRDFRDLQEGTQLVVILEPAVPFSGTVKDTEGRPVPQARVRLFPRGRPDLAPLSAETASSGRFRLDSVAPGRWDVTVDKDGLAPFHERMLVIPPPDGLRRNYVLEGGLTLRGTITTDGGKLVVGGALIEVIDRIVDGRRDINQSRRLGPYVSRPDGSFEIKALLPGVLVLLIKANGFGSMFHGHEVSTRNPSGLFAQIELPPVAKLGGRVLQPDGRPAGGVFVVLRPDGIRQHQFAEMAPFLLGAETWADELGDRWPAFRTKSDGTWKVENAPAVITARVQAVDPAGRFAGSRSTHVNLAKGGRPGIELKLLPGVSISGRVTGADGSAVVGASVKMAGVRDVTGEDGSYRLRGVPEGTQRIRVSHRLALPYVETLEVPPGGIDPLDIVVERGAIIRGVVTDTFGNPLVGAMASVRNHQDDRHGKKGRMLNFGFVLPDGTFEVGGFMADLVDVVVSAQGYETSRRDGIAPDPRAIRFELVDQPWELGGDITGEVVDGLTKAPIKGLTIDNVHPRRVEMVSGSFVVRNQRPGHAVLSFVAPGYQRHVEDGVDVRSGSATDLGRILMYPAGSLSVTIRDKRGRVYKGAAQVSVEERGRQKNPRWATRPRRKDAAWVFPSLRPGPYGVVVRVRGHRAAKAQAMVLKPNQSVTVTLK